MPSWCDAQLIKHMDKFTLFYLKSHIPEDSDLFKLPLFLVL
jgi:hypothetical protein